MMAEFEVKNVEYHIKLVEEKKVDFRKFPDDVLKTLRKYNDEVIQEIVDSDPMSKKVFDSYNKYQKATSNWSKIAEINYM